MSSKKYALFLLLIIPILLAACSGAASPVEFPASEPDVLQVAVGAPEAEEMAAAGEMGRDAAFDDFASQTNETVERLVIKNANLTIVIPDPGASASAIGQMAEEMGGFVVSSNFYQTTTETGEEVPRGNLTIRVPSDKFNEAISRIESSATDVLSKNESGQDVTQEYTDLQSRLRNLESAEAQLQVIMEDARRTEDVISVFNQLTATREQIEVIKGRIQYLEQSAAFSAIAIELIADAAVQPITVGGWQPGGVAKEAIQDLINALTIIADFAIRLVLYILPVLLILALPVILVVWFVRRRRRGKSKEQAVESPESK